ncbi:MAG TPA: 5'/3'-nucleotidase SurE [Opitutaceae bacterium]|jgi:5'-nucleotidase|nr:5'/3'-nucleotidase SurE [Opitutaceae bacterium]
MKLLVTNDDGIDCLFLHELVFGLREAGYELAVVAPKTEQSWISAAKSRTRPVRSTKIDCGFGCPTWTVDGTPADCVNIALAHLVKAQPDAVVSGINVGLNASLGFILASGTVAGAFEGVLHGLPAVAFSQDLSFETYDHLKDHDAQPDEELRATLRTSARHAGRLVKEFVAGTPPQSFIVHNVNFPYPSRAESEVRRTVPARMVIPGLFSPAQDDGTHRFVFHLGQDHSPAEPLTDRAALAQGFISHTILDYTRLGQP